MDEYQRGRLWRTGIGSLIGGAASIAIYLYGQTYMFAHTNPRLILSYYYLYYFGRVPWIALMGITLAVVGYLATVRLDYRNQETPIVVTTGGIGLGLTIVFVSFQEFFFQGGSFFFDFFAILLLNIGWFLVVAMIPFMVGMTLLHLIMGFTHRSRSARELMPPELLAQFDERQRKRHK